MIQEVLPEETSRRHQLAEGSEDEKREEAK